MQVSLTPLKQSEPEGKQADAALTGTPTAPTANAGTSTTQIATTEFVSSAVNNLIDSAPGALDTLNELAAALGDDQNFATTVTNSIAAVQADVDQNENDADTAILELDGNVNDLISLSGVAENATDLGTFTGATIADSSTVKVALQALETSLELKADSTTVTEIDGNVDDLVTLSGVAETQRTLVHSQALFCRTT